MNGPEALAILHAPFVSGACILPASEDGHNIFGRKAFIEPEHIVINTMTRTKLNIEEL
jgi:hypothetical protein